MIANTIRLFLPPYSFSLAKCFGIPNFIHIKDVVFLFHSDLHIWNSSYSNVQNLNALVKINVENMEWKHLFFIWKKFRIPIYFPDILRVHPNDLLGGSALELISQQLHYPHKVWARIKNKFISYLNRSKYMTSQSIAGNLLNRTFEKWFHIWTVDVFA